MEVSRLGSIDELCQALAGSFGPLTSTAHFNDFCRMVVAEASASSDGRSPTSSHVSETLARIAAGGPGIIKTSWGGVDVLRYSAPLVEKYLAIKGGRYLAYEYHDEKSEELFVLDGLVVLLTADRDSGEPRLRPMSRGAYASFQPGERHCLIAIQDALVFERSLDPRGMDQDLQFVFLPDDAAK